MRARFHVLSLEFLKIDKKTIKVSLSKTTILNDESQQDPLDIIHSIGQIKIALS